MSGTIGIAPNVRAYVWRRGVFDRVHQSHNIITTAGLTAWAYNLVNSDGETIDRFAVGSGTTAPALGDTTLDTSLAEYSDFEMYPIGDTLVVLQWLMGTLRDTEDGNTVNEVGLWTRNNGATESSNKLLTRAVLDVGIDIDLETIAIFVYNITIKRAGSGTDAVFTDYGKNWAVGRLRSLLLDSPLDKVAFGTGTKINGREASTATTAALGTEQYRKTPNTSAWARTATAGQVEATGTLTAAEAFNGTLTEMGPAVGVTASNKQIYQKSSMSGDNTGALTFVSRITLANI